MKKGASTKKKTSSEHTGIHVEKMLIENFVALQKVLTQFSEKFDKLSTNISQLLKLFESSAKGLAEKEFRENKNEKGYEEIIEKINSLIEQNKIIARGLTLLHEPGQEQQAPFLAPIPLAKKKLPQLPSSELKPFNR